MRTVILILGLLFCELLAKHWGINLVSDFGGKFLSVVLMFAVVLDCAKKQ